jgi:predicted alpha/beta hydrolase
MNALRIDNVVEFPPFEVPATWYPAAAARATPRATPRATMVLLPALGTGARYYQPFAQALAARGFNVLAPELPGTGDSRPRPSRSVDFGYRDLVERYLPGLVAAARQRAAVGPVVLAGHSLGAQVAALAVLHGHAAPQALITIAGGFIHYRNWDGRGALAVWGAAVLVSASTWLFGYLPGRGPGFGTPAPRTLMREWSRTIRRGRFPPVAGERRAAGQTPVLSICYTGDFLAPQRSAAALAERLAGQLVSLPVDWPGKPHASWARHPEATVRCIDDWLVLRQVAPPA